MEGFKIDPARYANLPPGEAKRRMEEDERKAINADPGLRAHIRDMETRQAQERAEAEHRAEEERRKHEKEFKEALERHYTERMEFYRLSRGVPEKVFEQELWPEIRRAFIAGEPDEVDRAWRSRSTDVF